MRRRLTVTLAFVVAVAILVVGPEIRGSRHATAAPDRVLILDGTVTGGASSIEGAEAAADGFAVDVVDAATWSSMTAAQFAGYRAIILGDPTCYGPGTSPDIDAAAANAMTWGPVVNGNIVIIGTDPVFHASQGGTVLTQRGVDFATAASGKTGAYISLSCYYHNTASGTKVPLLDGIGPGGFTVTGVGCYNDAHIVADHPALAGLTDADLSNWGCSVHEAFQTWPGSLVPLAIARSFDSSYTASDGSQGPPYILAGGDIRSFPLSLSPLADSAPAGGTHTVTGELLDQSTRLPVSGAKLGFSVISGPNTGATGTCNPSNCLTDAAGHVTWTYTSNGQEGADTIQGFYDQNNNGTADAGEPQTTAGMQWTTVSHHNLAVTKSGTGSGTVTSAPPGIDCGATCSQQFNDGTSVTLTATADPGSTFAGWSGDCTGMTCTVNMDADHSVTATFNPTPVTLSVTKGGDGTGSVTSNPTGIDCGATCSASFNQGTSVTLTATADPGSTFAGWSGDCTGMTCTVNMDADHSVTATFTKQPAPPECKPGNGYGDKNHCHNGPPGHDHPAIIVVFVFHSFCSHFFGWWDSMWWGSVHGW